LTDIKESVAGLPNLREVTIRGNFRSEALEMSREMSVSSHSNHQDAAIFTTEYVDRLWDAALRSFKSSTLVKFVPSKVIPAFMEDFCDRFQVD